MAAPMTTTTTAAALAAPAPSLPMPAAGDEITEQDLQTLQEFIENALDLMLKGNATSYQFLIQQLTTSSGKSDACTRRKIYLALPRCISTMAKEPSAYHQLLDVLFKFDFLGDRTEVDAYTGFLVHLVSSNTVYVLPTLQMLIRNLCRPQQLPPHLSAAVASAMAPPKVAKIAIGGSFGTSFSAPVAATTVPVKPIDVEQRIQERFDVVHAILQRILKLVPTAANALFPVIVEHFPHKRLEAEFQVAYLQNVLALSKYLPGLQERIFALIIDRLVAIDVEIKLDDKEEDVFTMDDFLEDDLLPGDADAHLDEMADKLDHMMVVMFEHIEQFTQLQASESKVNAENAALVFKYLLKVFEHSILNTHRSKYPQFLLFYVCQMDPQFQDVFISQLLSASLDPQTPPVTRHSCGAYLASFLARAKYISVSYIQKALYHLLKWMHDQMDIYDATFQLKQPTSDDELSPRSGLAAEAAEIEQNKRGYFHESIFISTLQTVCYLVCYRGLEVAQAENGYEFLRSLGWERLLITPTSYCPLAFCQQTVATEFLNFVETFDLVSEECIDQVDQAISTIGKMQKRTKKTKTMERTQPPPTAANSSSSLPASASGSSVLGLREPLETFFPFDPYLLRRSFRFIGPIYLYWKHVDPTASENTDALNVIKEIIQKYQEDEDDDDDEDSDDQGDNDDETEAMSLAGSVTMASFKEEHYLNVDRDLSMSVSSSLDDEDQFGSFEGGQIRIKRTVKKVVSRTAFAPSPALSASSPPSQLPPLNTGFTLSGFDDELDDEGF